MRQPRIDPARPVQPPVGTLLRRGLVKHCPLCGSGHLFRRWFTLRERCPRCGLRFERVEGHWTGDLGINVIVSFGSLLVTLIVGFLVSYPQAPGMWLLALAIGVAVGVPILCFPFSKTIWLAIDLAMRPVEPDELAVDRPGPDPT